MLAKIKDDIHIHQARHALNQDAGHKLPPVHLQIVTHDAGHVTCPQ